MIEHFNKSGDVSLTICHFGMNKNNTIDQPPLTIQYVDSWLDQLTTFTHENDQQKHLQLIASR